MRDDYLWDGSGKPDPEVQRLELLLGRLRHNRPAPEFAAKVVRFPRFSWEAFFPLRAALAAMMLVAIGTWVVTRGPNGAWDVISLEGRPLVGSNHIGDTGRLDVGEWLETDAASRAKMNMGAVGEVEVEPNTRVRLVRARQTEHRVALERGKIHARIWAPPRLFFVETPSALAVDLGCIYTLEVDRSGRSLLRTALGWVGFEWKGRESFVPAGAACATRPGIGPGTPYFEDASEAFRAALTRLDFEVAEPAARAAALRAVLTESRRQDGLTLWHLLARTTGEERGQVYDRLAGLILPPAGTTREGVLRGDKQTLDLWWNALGLGEAGWWRLWKGPYPSRQ